MSNSNNEIKVDVVAVEGNSAVQNHQRAKKKRKLPIVLVAIALLMIIGIAQQNDDQDSKDTTKTMEVSQEEKTENTSFDSSYIEATMQQFKDNYDIEPDSEPTKPGLSKTGIIPLSYNSDNEGNGYSISVNSKSGIFLKASISTRDLDNPEYFIDAVGYLVGDNEEKEQVAQWLSDKWFSDETEEMVSSSHSYYLKTYDEWASLEIWDTNYQTKIRNAA